MLLTELIKHDYMSSQDDESNSEKMFLCINNIYNQNMKTVNSYVFIDLGYYNKLYLVLSEQTTLSRCFELFKYSVTGQSRLPFFHYLKTQNRKKVNNIVI